MRGVKSSGQGATVGSHSWTVQTQIPMGIMGTTSRARAQPLVKSFNLPISHKAELAARPGLEFGALGMYCALL